jgi:hypothetical protein
VTDNSQIEDSEVVAAKNKGNNILSDVVDVALDRG